MGTIEILQKEVIKSGCSVIEGEERLQKFVAGVYVYYQEYFKTGRKKGSVKSKSYSLYFDTQEAVQDVCDEFKAFGYDIKATHINELKQMESFEREKEKQKIKYYFDFFHNTELI